MNGDWQVGDLALCVKPEGNGHLRLGAIYTVIFVGLDGQDRIGLCVDEAFGDGYLGGFLASRFVKITPRAADLFDAAVINSMRMVPVEGRAA